MHTAVHHWRDTPTTSDQRCWWWQVSSGLTCIFPCVMFAIAVAGKWRRSPPSANPPGWYTSAANRRGKCDGCCCPFRALLTQYGRLWKMELFYVFSWPLLPTFFILSLICLLVADPGFDRGPGVVCKISNHKVIKARVLGGSADMLTRKILKSRRSDMHVSPVTLALRSILTTNPCYASKIWCMMYFMLYDVLYGVLYSLWCICTLCICILWCLW